MIEKGIEFIKKHEDTILEFGIMYTIGYIAGRRTLTNDISRLWRRM